MATPVLMPQQGNTVEECLLVGWKKKKGDTVAKGDILADIETDKAAFELEAPESGTILELFAKAGELVPVLTNIAVIGAPGEATDAFKPDKTKAKPAAAAAPVPSQSKPSGAAPAAPVQSSTAFVSTENAGATHLSPRARAYLKRHPVNISQIHPTGANNRITEKDLRLAWNNAGRISPMAAELMAQKARAPESGTGPNGLIRSSDMSEPGKSLTGIRAIIADRMMESLATTAQYTVSTQAPAEGLLALRKKFKAAAMEITIGDMVMFACVKTLKEFPALNTEFTDNTVYTQKKIHLGFACDTPRGLLVPVIKDCGEISLADLAKRAKTLAQKAQDNKISPEELTGGTFTVSNLGSFGVTSFTPVINAPQAAILGVCAITLAPVRKEGKIEFEDKIGFSLTADHQTVDGALAARFLVALGNNIAKIEALSGPKE